jgi:hypothetical protein
MGAHPILQTATLAERGSSMLLSTVSAFQSVEDRDAMVASAMERGVHDSEQRLVGCRTAEHHRDRKERWPTSSSQWRRASTGFAGFLAEGGAATRC